MKKRDLFSILAVLLVLTALTVLPLSVGAEEPMETITGSFDPYAFLRGEGYSLDGQQVKLFSGGQNAYDPEKGFGGQLSDFQKQIYDGFVETYVDSTTGLSNGETGGYSFSFDIPDGYNLSTQIFYDLNSAYFAFITDYMGMFWMGEIHYSISYNATMLMPSGTIDAKYPGANTEATINAYEAGVNSVVSELQTKLNDASNWAEYPDNVRPLLAIHNWLIDNLSYCNDALRYPNDNLQAFSSGTVFAGNKIVVCEGYAEAFKVLCDRFDDIEASVFVSGEVVQKNGGSWSEPHAWNEVMVDDKWYYVDSLWSQTSSEWGYFLLGNVTVTPDNSTIPGSRTFSTKLNSASNNIMTFTLPAVNQTGYGLPCDGNWDWDVTDGTLTLSGEGAVPAYPTVDRAPWYSSVSSITEVVVEDGITGLGEGVFSGLKNATKIVIPGTVTSLKSGLLKGCDALKDLTLPFPGLTADAVGADGRLSILFEQSNSGSVIQYFDYDSSTGGFKGGYYNIPAIKTLRILNASDIAEGALSGLSITQLYLNEVGSIDNIALYGTNSLTDVWFLGSETEWNSITVGAGNSILSTATIHYNADDLSAAFVHSCSFNNNMALNYYVPQSALTGCTGIELHLSREKYGAAEPEEVILSDYTSANLDGTDYYRFAYNGIAACEIGDQITAVLHVTRNGMDCASEEDVYSVQQYAYNRLENSSDAELKVMLVDMLNYASDAQTYFGYNASALANAALTDAQKALGTSETPALTAEAVLTNADGKAVAFYAKSVVLNNNVELKYYLTFPEGADLTNVKAKFSYTPNKGEKQTIEIPASQFVYNAGQKAYSVKLSTIAAADMGQTVTAEIYDGSELISGTLEYSIEAYAKSRLEKSTDDTFKVLLADMVKFSRSAKAYFTK